MYLNKVLFFKEKNRYGDNKRARDQDKMDMVRPSP